MKNFSANKREANLRKVKSVYFISYDCYRKSGGFATCGNFLFESHKNNLCFGSLEEIKKRLIDYRGDISDFITIIKNVQKIK